MRPVRQNLTVCSDGLGRSQSSLTVLIRERCSVARLLDPSSDPCSKLKNPN